MTPRVLRSAVAALCAMLSPAPAFAGPTIWDIARNPELRQANDLMALAERSRVPADDVLTDLAVLSDQGVSDELNRQLNARAAALITIADGDRMPDVRLQFLLGDALVSADRTYLAEGRTHLEQALARHPESPLAASAWFSLAVAEGKLGHHAAEGAAYTQALDSEWRRERRATILMNRAESHMSALQLPRSLLDYRQSMALSRLADTRSLALWGLAVATERDGDLPTALEYAREASSYRFGPPSHQVVSLDLPNVFFTPEYEEHYYRALAAMAEGRAETNSDRSRLLLQTASLLWSLYLDSAQGDTSPWSDNARRHRSWCRQQLEALDSTAAAADD